MITRFSPSFQQRDGGTQTTWDENTKANPYNITQLINAILALDADLNDWIALPQLTYVSSTTATAMGDYTGLIEKGDRLWWLQTTSHYGIIYDVSYNSGTNLTTFTIINNSDYVFANAAISNAYYSRLPKPYGFPFKFNYVPNIGGFSALPTNVVYRFSVIGNEMHVTFRQGTNGTSNATTFTATLPCAARNITNMVWVAPIFAFNNGVVSITAQDYVNATAGSTSLTLVKNTDNNNWTNTGGKRANFDIWVEI
jgi:hypothetical protein